MSRPEWWGDFKARWRFFQLRGHVKRAVKTFEQCCEHDLLPGDLQQFAKDTLGDLLILQQALADIQKEATESVDTTSS